MSSLHGTILKFPLNISSSSVFLPKHEPLLLPGMHFLFSSMPPTPTHPPTSFKHHENFLLTMCTVKSSFLGVARSSPDQAFQKKLVLANKSICFCLKKTFPWTVRAET